MLDFPKRIIETKLKLKEYKEDSFNMLSELNEHSPDYSEQHPLDLTLMQYFMFEKKYL